MTQYEAVVRVMEQKGGYATLGELYQEVPRIRGVKWGTQTPDATIRRIVQTYPALFFKIRPGLWALCAWKHRLPDELRTPEVAPSREAATVFNHTFYQGLIVQLGNLQEFDTYVPAQDKNRVFLHEQRLGNVTTCSKVYGFTYEERVRIAKTIDVIWFNRRRLPAAFFEVEHTTDMRGAMLKFNELRDFRAEMYIVASAHSKRRFEGVRALDTYRDVRKYVRFLSYDSLAKVHSHFHALTLFGTGAIRALAAH